MEKLERIKNYLQKNMITPSYARILLFYLTFSALYFIGEKIRGGIEISYYIAEIGDQEVTVFLNYYLLYYLFILGAFFPIIAWKLHEKTKMIYFIENPLIEHRISTLDSLYLYSIGLYVFGTTTHFLANHYGDMSLYSYQLGDTQVYRGLYFFDEYLGHALMIGALLLMGCIELRIMFEIKEENMDKYGFLWVIPSGIGLGIGFAITMIEGQANIPVLVCIIISFIPIINKIRKKGITMQHKAIILIYLMMFLSYITTLLVYAIMYGLKSHYPYFYQTTETYNPR